MGLGFRDVGMRIFYIFWGFHGSAGLRLLANLVMRAGLSQLRASKKGFRV